MIIFCKKLKLTNLGVKKEDLKETKLSIDFENKETTQAGDDKYLKRRLDSAIDPKVAKQLSKGSIYACISSRPGQSGRVDGYILEGAELDFYQKRMIKKKTK